ncbi:McrC family protein [Candidatus Micrarchaeota archaeon]|nr:McrC family protein [Candidatus Micrarchaeota archaeon]
MEMNKSKGLEINVKEYGKITDTRDIYKEKPKIVEKDLNYAKELGDKLTFRCWESGEIEVNASSYVGIIKFPSGIKLIVSQKINSDLAEMLTYLSDIEGFENRIYFNPDIEIKLPLGFEFFPLIIFLFVKEVRKIIRLGLTKRYVKKEENIRKLRGSINILKNECYNHNNKSKIYCDYSELSENIIENKIIFYCCQKLKRDLPAWMDKNKDKGFNSLNSQLNRVYMYFEERVSLTKIKTDDIKKINMTKLNKRYDYILKLAKIIISEEMYSSFKSDKDREETTGVNFLIDMNWVYESFITKIIEELGEENNFKVKTQKYTEDLIEVVGNNEIRRGIKPDLLITTCEGEEIPLDTKYKKTGPNLSDYYQIICYSLAKKSKRCALIIAIDENEKKESSIPAYRVDKETGIELEISVLRTNLINGGGKLKDKIKMKLKEELVDNLINNLSNK